ncbi:MAG: SAM-dependent methyltransferase [Rhodobacteraceae bacterium]|jgi:SAM-dependent methyltransferase|nr:SAM-dependent methyltransferase [Paracoccaceae bacterium]
MNTPPSPPALTDRAARARFLARALRNPALFLHHDAADDIQERLTEVNRVFTAPAVVTPFAPVWRERLPDARIVADDPVLDLRVGAHDLVIHALSLHWADDPLGQIIQCRRALKPDGLFIGVLFGGQTLNELRAVLAQAESDVTGSIAPRVAPMGEIRDLGALLLRAGLALPVADGFTRTILYRDVMHLVHDMRAMGESNALASRHRAPLPRGVLARAQDLYRQTFADPEGRLKASVETLFLTGWAPSDTQQKPLRPGSAATRLADALGAAETPLEPAPSRATNARKD